MKKLLLFGLLIVMGTSVNAQYKFVPKENVISYTKTGPWEKKAITGNETDLNTASKPNPTNPNIIISGASAKKTGTETVLGVTTYDLQSNSAMQTRIKNNGDGTMEAVWTYSESGDINAPDRGTGYNYFDGTNWGPAPTSRIEPQRIGWPNIATTSSGEEIIICHNTQASVITMDKRAAIGTGPWTSTNINTDYQIWHRTTIGGANGQTIHDISLRDPGAPIMGVAGHLLYYRSLNAGVTWDKQNVVIPGLDSTKFINMSGDAYSIDSQGDLIAIAYWGIFDDILLVKSTDNGETWSTTIVKDFPIDKYEVDVTATLDTTETGDETGAILIDNNGMVHMFYGEFLMMDDNLGDGQYTYFPLVNGLMYWNESMGDDEPVSIASVIDINGNGMIDIVDQATISDYRYSSLISWPSAGIDTNGCMYVSYSAIREDLDNGNGQNYRHMYVVKSCDGGCTWSFPIDVTDLPGGDNDYSECVYGSMARLVDSNIHIVYQKDFEPGIAVAGDDNDPYVTNEIIYIKVPLSDFDTVPAGVCLTGISGDTLFCAGDSVLLSATCGNSYLWSTGETTQSIYYGGAFGTVTVDITTDCDTTQESITVAAPITNPLITVTSTVTEMCNGDSAVLTVTANASGIISWSTGESTSSITVGTIGTYTVTFSNCGGVTVDSVTIDSLSAPPAITVTATNTTICNGDSTWISVSSVSQGTYLWSTGDTTTTIGVDSVGEYSVIVDNCGGTSYDTITISLPSKPAATITGNDLFCNGDSITLTAGAEPSATYVWSTGDSTQSIVVDTVVTVTMTVSNCGGDSSISVTTGFIAPPTLSVNINGSLSFCEDGGTTKTVLTAFAFGTGTFTYMWSNGDSSQSVQLDSTAQSGSYSVIVTNSCGDQVFSDTTTILITEAPSPSIITITHESAATANDGAIDATVGGGLLPYTYTWLPDSQSTEDISSLAPGTYTLTVTDSNGCIGTISGTVNQYVGIGEIHAGTISIHPNPNNGQFTVELNDLSSESYHLEVRNIIGQIVYADVIQGGTVDRVNIDLSNQEKGIYVFTISNSKSKRTEKLIVH